MRPLLLVIVLGFSVGCDLGGCGGCGGCGGSGGGCGVGVSECSSVHHDLGTDPPPWTRDVPDAELIDADVFGGAGGSIDVQPPDAVDEDAGQEVDEDAG